MIVGPTGRTPSVEAVDSSFIDETARVPGITRPACYPQGVGPAVDWLGPALQTASGPWHRGLMVVVLGQLAGRDPAAVAAALKAAIAAERHPAVLAMATAARDEIMSAKDSGVGTGVGVDRADCGRSHPSGSASSQVDRG